MKCNGMQGLCDQLTRRSSSASSFSIYIKCHSLEGLCDQLTRGVLENRAHFSRRINLRGHMPQFTVKMNVFLSISWETPYMSVETLKRVLVFPRWLIWHVTCLGLHEKCMFSHLSPYKPHKCLLKPSEECSFFQDDCFEGSHASAYTKNEHFPIYLLRNPRNVSWNPQNSAHFSKTINLRGHMPWFTLKMSIFPSISWETPKMCVETFITGTFFLRRSIWGVTYLGLL